MELTPTQRRIVESARDHTLFLYGDAGTGKTTAAVGRILSMIEQGVPSGEILILLPHAALAQPYQRALRSAALPPGAQVDILTFGALVLQTVKLFWGLAAKRAGFQPDTPPSFLTLETAQYVMSTIVDPLIETRGYFEGVTISRNRLYAQIVDNLEKAALSGFPHTEIAERMKNAVLTDSSGTRAFEQAQECAILFRDLCRANNLLDFSLQVEVFTRHLWTLPEVRAYWTRRGAHLIVDNLEEGTPAMHRMVAGWMPDVRSAVLIMDSEAGFRRFLSASPETAGLLRDRCDDVIEFEDTLVMTPSVAALGDELAQALGEYAPESTADPREAMEYGLRRFYPQMLNWVADEITLLVKDEGVPPGEIVILAPYMSDAIRFTLMQRLQGEGIPVRSHRPSRSLREEPAARALLTLAALAHPEWGMQPAPFDVAYMLMQAIGSAGAGRNLDLIRAQLLAENAYPGETKSRLAPFDTLKPDVQERITYLLAPRYEELRLWLEAYIAEREQARANPAAAPAPKKKGRKKKNEPEAASPSNTGVRLDHFFSRLFGEVLSQRGYGFHGDFDASTAAGSLVESAANFRRAFENTKLIPADKTAAEEFVRMVDRGLLADQYARAWAQNDQTDAVLIAPAYTFLIRNQPVTTQFWLDLGSRGWFERLFQPLTHPYILSATWENNRAWTDDDEYEARHDSLFHLVIGLVRRCRERIYFGVSELGENGSASTGELLQAFGRMIARLNPPEAADDQEDDDAEDTETP